jgi:hypothetical protein
VAFTGPATACAKEMALTHGDYDGVSYSTGVAELGDATFEFTTVDKPGGTPRTRVRKAPPPWGKRLKTRKHQLPVVCAVAGSPRPGTETSGTMMAVVAKPEVRHGQIVVHGNTPRGRVAALAQKQAEDTEGPGELVVDVQVGVGYPLTGAEVAGVADDRLGVGSGIRCK